jgi:DNA-binding GntR family transcriptional regulator
MARMAIAVLDRRVRLSDQAYAALRRLIVRGDFPPGAQLIEGDLAAQLGISRTPLREALLRLAEEGLVVVYPQFGSFVAPIQIDAAREAQFIREHLERAVIRDLARTIDARGMARLQDNVTQQEAAARDGDADRFYELDEELHATFAELANHPGVWKLLQQTKAHLDRVRRLSLPLPDHIPRLLVQHRAIVAALATHDEADADAALRDHLREVFNTIASLDLGGQTAMPPLQRRRGP